MTAVYNCAGNEENVRGGSGFQFGVLDITLGGTVRRLLQGYFETPQMWYLSSDCSESPEYGWIKIGVAKDLEAFSCAVGTCAYGRLLTRAIKERDIEIGQKSDIAF